MKEIQVTWFGGWMDAGSRPTLIILKGVWAGSWRVASSPHEHCQGAHEQGIEPLTVVTNCLKTLYCF